MSTQPTPTTGEVFAELAEGIERRRQSAGEQPESITVNVVDARKPRPGYSIHDPELVDEAGGRLKKAAAITDLLVNCDPEVLATVTVSDATWAVYELIEECRELVCAKHPEVQS